MWEGLLTGGGVRRTGIVLSGPIFSKADDCANLVLSFKALNMNGYFHRSFWSICENVWLADKTGLGIALAKWAVVQSAGAERGGGGGFTAFFVRAWPRRFFC
jgi:hypothetical protein